MTLFDAHLHLDDAAFDADRAAVIARARAAGVVGMVTAGTDVASCRRALALAAEHRGIFAAVAIHPYHAQEAGQAALAAVEAMAGDPRAVAVGETGLDPVRATASPEAQAAVFRAHLRLARERDLPVVVHCREAYEQVLEILEQEEARRVVMHAFSGSPAIARRCAERGYFISLGGPVTYRNAGTAAPVAREVPLELLLLETDAPVLPPEPHRGRRNEPSYLPLVAARVAALRGMTPEAVAEATTANARRVFRVDG